MNFDASPTNSRLKMGRFLRVAVTTLCMWFGTIETWFTSTPVFRAARAIAYPIPSCSSGVCGVSSSFRNTHRVVSAYVPRACISGAVIALSHRRARRRDEQAPIRITPHVIPGTYGDGSAGVAGRGVADAGGEGAPRSV